MLRTLTLSALLLGSVAPSAAQCIQSNGQVACVDGRVGFVDASGNVWMQDENSQQGVMLNLDNGYREGRQNDGPVIEENGTLHRMR
jgi:hypothetical protein